VNKERSGKGLSTLETYVIDLIGEEGGADSEVASKMGSTGIRKWLASQGKDGQNA
jgi:phosphopantetheine adenylyltransferase